MGWQELQDPENKENKNAGNGGDLVKHTVYLTVLDYLLARSPWSAELRVRECHAGRGMYRIPAEDSRRPLLRCLYEPVEKDSGLLLHDAQRASQMALGAWASGVDDFDWYSGSAVLNAWRLGQTNLGRHRLELYEMAPDTRDVLRALFAEEALQYPQVDVRVLPAVEDGRDFDGEEYIARKIAVWDTRDLVVLDPFAMWRQEGDQQRRDVYRRIFDQLLAAGSDSPSLLLFWTWGQAHKAAERDLEGTARRVRNGYQDLRELIHEAERHMIRVRWTWELRFAMWILLSEKHVRQLRASLQHECEKLRDHLSLGGCTWKSPDIEVVID